MTAVPIPPEPSRGDVLGRLRRERWLAADAREYGRVAELDAQIAKLSAASAPRAPSRETAAASRPGAEKTAAKKTAAEKTTARRAATTRGKNRVTER